MKQKIDISLELKNELNLIRDTYIAVIENRIREMTIDDVKKGIKCYQIVGFEELPDLLSDSDEDIEAFVDEIFSKVVKIGVSEEAVIKPRTPEQQALAIDLLDKVTIEVIRKNDSKQKLDVRHMENRSMKHQIYDWLNSNWDGKNQADATRRLIDAKLCNVKESSLKRWVRDYKKEQLNK